MLRKENQLKPFLALDTNIDIYYMQSLERGLSISFFRDLSRTLIFFLQSVKGRYIIQHSSCPFSLRSYKSELMGLERSYMLLCSSLQSFRNYFLREFEYIHQSLQLWIKDHSLSIFQLSSVLKSLPSENVYFLKTIINKKMLHQPLKLIDQ